MRKRIGFSEADILLPSSKVCLSKWPVIACDQYTSEGEYWDRVEEIVGSSPSTLRIMLPEYYLESPDKASMIESVNKTMDEYLDNGVFDEYSDSYVLVERGTESGTRFGLVGKLDLDEYDFSPESVSLIRATEGTILSRIPPRVEIRKNAPIELPHIVVLINDPERSVIEPLKKKRDSLKKLYDTELMLGGGKLKGYLVDSDEDRENVAAAINRLFEKADKKNPLVFAMGDGNHSLATAKTIWEEKKKTLTDEQRKNDRAKYALVEIENIYDDGVKFEPIHRVLFSVTKEAFDSLLLRHAQFEKEEMTKENALESVNIGSGRFSLFDGSACFLYRITKSEKALPAWTIQSVIDDILNEGIGSVDYIHGIDSALSLGGNGNLSIILPDISKDSFFESILSDRAFPRKTFSIGHANEKRYYMEGRRI